MPSRATAWHCHRYCEQLDHRSKVHKEENGTKTARSEPSVQNYKVRLAF
jgi:hypothetical protein